MVRGVCRRLVDRVLDIHFQRAREHIRRELDRLAILAAQPRIVQLRSNGSLPRLREAELRIFSQFGEDGIIQYLIHHVPIEEETFIEFGVENYREANTRFLLVNNNWRGLIMDGNSTLASTLRDDPLYWRHDLNAVSAFITAENINGLIENAGLRGDIGLLSIDIDGNDYWVWQALTVVSPRIVICEYNSLFGWRHPVAVRYRQDFNITRAHYSNLFYGASLSALCHLAKEKGYEFVGSNSAGCNAFFVRGDLTHDLPRPTVEEGYVRSRFRSSTGEDGGLSFLTGDARIEAIAALKVVDVVTGRDRRVGEL
ncbi:MAG: hypothetical protein QOH31_1133 [Verrucomicrobiota bacterium]|jgi:hypothetical protein